VVDLAAAHVRAVERLGVRKGVLTCNLGTGRGYSVLEVIETFMHVTGQDVPYEIVERRPGDLPTSFADPSKANKELNWQATRSLDEMCADAWRWQSNNPNGYISASEGH
jgi:UDP-glucose 4-epimerase